MPHVQKPKNDTKNAALDKAPDAGKGKAIKAAAAKEPDFAAQERALAPAPAATSDALPGSTAELRANAAFKIASGGSFAGKAIPPALGAMLMKGISAEGVSDATSLEQAIADYLDEGLLNVLTITTPSGAAMTWLSFYAGDTEVGYIFAGAALKAIVSDGSINAA